MGINTLYGITSIAINPFCDFARNPFAELKSVFCTCPMPGTSKTGFGQVKIMKEFVWINRFFFLNMGFEQVGEKNYG